LIVTTVTFGSGIGIGLAVIATVLSVLHWWIRSRPPVIRERGDVYDSQESAVHDIPFDGRTSQADARSHDHDLG
jgi:hypothetical protein